MGGNILSKLTSKPLEFNEKPADETVTDMKTATDPASDKRPGIETVQKEKTVVETKPKENTADETVPKENLSDKTLPKEKQVDEKISNEKHSDETTFNNEPAEERFVFKKWDAVVSWSYEVENCETCKQGIQDLCTECKADAIEKDEYEACPVAWGVCNHCFHFNCIKKLHRNFILYTSCPLCDEIWEYKDFE